MVGRRFAVRAAQKAAKKAARPLAVRPKAALPALPAPPKPLALPPPDPSKALPPLAAKPRGGQWWSEKVAGARDLAPEVVARQQAEVSRFAGFTPNLSEDLGVPAQTTPEQEWLAKALARYYKNDFGSPEDPLRDLAARGLHYDPEMTPESWKATVDHYLMEDPLQDLMFPPNPMGGMPGAGDDMRGEALAAMPWLAKQPATNSVYGIGRGGLDLDHFEDELYNALNPDLSGLPADLALRPESLARMSFPQAVERVGRINQFRVKQMEEQANAALNNPAIQTFKEYPEAGYRWVELRKPEPRSGELPEGYSMRTTQDQTPGFSPRTIYEVVDPRGAVIADYLDPEEAIRMTWDDASHRPLQEALRFEGDTMGHCVGGYCDDVLSGRSRIFSLRDAKGQPHVTIETAPKSRVFSDVRFAVGPEQADAWLDEGVSLGEMVRRANLPEKQDIIQIKGKQNRAPVEDYLPYVQDFVKSGTWSNVGDLANTGLVQLPDGRFVTRQQVDEAMGNPAAAELLGPVPEWAARAPNFQNYTPEDWERIAPLFEGFAIGGRVGKDRCFSRHPMSVR